MNTPAENIDTATLNYDPVKKKKLYMSMEGFLGDYIPVRDSDRFSLSPTYYRKFWKQSSAVWLELKLIK